MKVKTDDLTGIALDWAVATCENLIMCDIIARMALQIDFEGNKFYTPSKDWAQGGPIIERELYKVTQNMGGTWSAQIKYRAPYYSPTYDYDIGKDAYHNAHGKTPLEAAMRCYVVSKLGSEVDIPDELLEKVK